MVSKETSFAWDRWQNHSPPSPHPTHPHKHTPHYIGPHTTNVPMGGYSCSFISVQFFLLVVKQTSYSRDDRLALLTSKIHRYDNQEPSQGVTNWYCTTAASRYFWGSNISLPCGAQNGFIPKEMELKHQKMRLNKIQGKTGPTGSSC